MTKYDKNGDMIVVTEHKTFNKQTSIITYGNISAPTMYGRHVRAYIDITPNMGIIAVEPGQHREWDLGWWDGLPYQNDIPIEVSAKVKKLAHYRPVWLYQFHHHSIRGDRHTKVIHGYLITSEEGKELHRHYANRSLKSESVVDVCSEIIIKEREG